MKVLEQVDDLWVPTEEDLAGSRCRPGHIWGREVREGAQKSLVLNTGTCGGWWEDFYGAGELSLGKLGRRESLDF